MLKIRFRNALLPALLGSLLTALMLHVAGGGATSSSRVYTLHNGDTASVAGLGWTCLAAPLQGARALSLLCSSDRKPIRSATISPTRITVDAGQAPTRSGRSYVFRFR